MTGYQEILTDPSYFGQIVTMTASQIGNYGINDEDAEAAAPKVSGFVVRELSPVVSNWRASLSLGDYLDAQRHPRDQRDGHPGPDQEAPGRRGHEGCLSTLPISDEDAVALARRWTDMAGADYVRNVTCSEPYLWPRGTRPPSSALPPSGNHLRRHLHPRAQVPGRRLRLRRQALHLPQARPPRLRRPGVPGHGLG